MLLEDRRVKPITVGVSGPTGAGKTSIVRFLANHYGCQNIDEKVPSSLLDAFPSSPSEFGFTLQFEIISAKLRGARSVQGMDCRVLDRTIEEDRDVFFNLHYQLGSISKRQLEWLIKYSEEVETSLGSPDLIVYLNSDVEKLRERMTQRRNPRWLLESLETQLELYKAWAAKISVPYVEVDTTLLLPEDLYRFGDWVFRSMRGVLAGSYAEYADLQTKWKTGLHTQL